AKNLLSGATSRIQQINFQAHSETPQEPDDCSAQPGDDDIPQYVDYDPDDPENDAQYDSSHDFYAPYGSDIMHNLIEHPSVLNPLPSDRKPSKIHETTAPVCSQGCNTCSAK